MALACQEWADDKKAENPVLLDLSELEGPAAIFLICSGTSRPQLKAIAESIESGMRDVYGMKPFGRDGHRTSEWLVLDYGLILVHILTPTLRDYYQIEDLWQDGRILKDEN